MSVRAVVYAFQQRWVNEVLILVTVMVYLYLVFVLQVLDVVLSIYAM